MCAMHLQLQHSRGWGQTVLLVWLKGRPWLKNKLRWTVIEADISCQPLPSTQPSVPAHKHTLKMLLIKKKIKANKIGASNIVSRLKDELSPHSSSRLLGSTLQVSSCMLN